jgi:hypothetical protein
MMAYCPTQKEIDDLMKEIRNDTSFANREELLILIELIYKDGFSINDARGLTEDMIEKRDIDISNLTKSAAPVIIKNLRIIDKNDHIRKLSKNTQDLLKNYLQKIPPKSPLFPHYFKKNQIVTLGRHLEKYSDKIGASNKIGAEEIHRAGIQHYYDSLESTELSHEDRVNQTAYHFDVESRSIEDQLDQISGIKPGKKSPREVMDEKEHAHYSKILTQIYDKLVIYRKDPFSSVESIINEITDYLSMHADVLKNEIDSDLEMAKNLIAGIEPGDMSIKSKPDGYYLVYEAQEKKIENNSFCSILQKMTTVNGTVVCI